MTNKEKLYLAKQAGFLYKDLPNSNLGLAQFDEKGETYPTMSERYAEPRWFTRPFTTTNADNMGAATEASGMFQDMLRSGFGDSDIPKDVEEEYLSEKARARAIGEMLVQQRPRMYRPHDTTDEQMADMKARLEAFRGAGHMQGDGTHSSQELEQKEKDRELGIKSLTERGLKEKR